MPLPHRVLFFDLETSPAIANVWRAKTEYVPMDMMLAEPFIINWGAKWGHQTRVISGLVTPEEARARDDSRIVADLADIIRQADAVVAHNGSRFDLPVFNGRLIKYGLEPLGPVRMIDTLTLSRNAFGLVYHKLDYLGEYLGLGRKIKTDIDLWKGCVAGDQAALNQMKRYNRQDVLLLEKVFEAMKPYVKYLPRLFDAAREEERVCPFCGSEDLMARGFYRTQASTFAKLQCNKCARYSRYRTVARLKKIGVHPL
jgi:hypothetical protein